MRLNRTVSTTIFSLLISMFVSAGCGDDKKTNPNGDGGDADVTIEIVANDGADSYSPGSVSVTVGQTVAWHNTHNMTHTATANGGAFNTGNISPGAASSPITMNTAGSFGYHCTPHPSMVGTVQVNP